MTKILLLAANPKDTGELQLYQEIYEIDQEVRRARFGTQFNFEARPQVRLRDLSQLLAEVKPDIVHFSGHGSASSEIIFVDDDGNGRPVESEVLKTIFAHLKGKIRCVVLNACYAEQQADAIAREIDCVVGMLGTIDDKAAISFAREFYRQLANGKDIGTAFELGRAQIPSGQKLARLHSIKANPSHIVFSKEQRWSKYFASIGIILIITSIIGLGNYFGLYSPSSTSTASITMPSQLTPSNYVLLLPTSEASEIEKKSLTDTADYSSSALLPFNVLEQVPDQTILTQEQIAKQQGIASTAKKAELIATIYDKMKCDNNSTENCPHTASMRVRIDAVLEYIHLERLNSQIPNLSFADLQLSLFGGVDLSKVNFYKADFREAKLNNTNFSFSDLSLTKLSQSDFRYSNLSSTLLYSSDLRNANLFKANLRQAEVLGASFRDAVLVNADLSQVTLLGDNGIYGIETKLTQVKHAQDRLVEKGLFLISELIITQTIASVAVAQVEASLQQSSTNTFNQIIENIQEITSTKVIYDDDLFQELEQAIAATPKAIATLATIRIGYLAITGAVKWQEIFLISNAIIELLDSPEFMIIDFRKANLSQANLSHSDLRFGNFSGAILVGANMDSAKLSHATLVGANLTDANLASADFSNSNLSSVNFSNATFDKTLFLFAKYDKNTKWPEGFDYRNISAFGPEANLTKLDLQGIDFSDIDLSNSNLSEAVLIDANLASAKLDGANLLSATYSEGTKWPANFNPQLAGAILIKQPPN